MAHGKLIFKCSVYPIKFILPTCKGMTDQVQWWDVDTSNKPPPMGPPFPLTTGKEINDSLLAYCTSGPGGPGGSNSPLCNGITLSNVVNNYLNNISSITPEQQARATEIFEQNVANNFSPTELDTKDVGASALFVVLPILLIGIISLWYMYSAKWITWPVLLYGLVIIIVISYVSLVAYRDSLIKALTKLQAQQRTLIEQQQTNAIYWPSALLAVMYSLQ